jgi:hypothetical protein
MCLVICGMGDVFVGVVGFVAVGRCSVIVLVARRNHFVPFDRSDVLESPVASINHRLEPYLPCHRAVDGRPSRYLCSSSCVQSLLARPPTSLDAIVLSRTCLAIEPLMDVHRGICVPPRVSSPYLRDRRHPSTPSFSRLQSFALAAVSSYMLRLPRKRNIPRL